MMLVVSCDETAPRCGYQHLVGAVPMRPVDSAILKRYGSHSQEISKRLIDDLLRRNRTDEDRVGR
jgi:hypothetical protein